MATEVRYMQTARKPINRGLALRITRSGQKERFCIGLLQRLRANTHSGPTDHRRFSGRRQKGVASSGRRAYSGIGVDPRPVNRIGRKGGNKSTR
ncbi:MAG: hypothetical protein ACK518_03830 [bacterium]